MEDSSYLSHSVAIIGISCRLPGATGTDQFWDLLQSGNDSFRTFTDEECLRSGYNKSMVNDPSFVKRGAPIDNHDFFDAKLFNYTPHEAKYLDPQQRILLECCYSAMENSGYNLQNTPETTGVYCGVGLNNYLLKSLQKKDISFEDFLDFQTIISNDKDYLSTRISYKLGLTGPSIVVQSACSTSLVAISLAANALLSGQCDYAFAGGVSLQWPRAKGYLYKEGQIFSKHGIVRTFDKNADGTILGEGAGVVLLKRAEDAVKDRDFIWALIRGSAINNDGTEKTGYTAPSISGQSAVIEMAQILADVSAEQISYIETHGTGTPLGDPIEVAGLSDAFLKTTEKKQFCALGALKTQIGHLDVASGVAGLIKVALMLHHKTLIPVLNFSEPNPELKLDKTPFYICTEKENRTSGQSDLIAGVSSFGIGGTNAHAILQNAPIRSESIVRKKQQILPLSAHTSTALSTHIENLCSWFDQHHHFNIADAAYTLQTGRINQNFRTIIVADTPDTFKAEASRITPSQFIRHAPEMQKDSIAFLYSGQGAQYSGMSSDIYREEPVFRSAADRCLEHFKTILPSDVYSSVENTFYSDVPNRTINETSVAQPSTFILEYALTQLWNSWGISPKALIGHSLGEISAAVTAGIMTLKCACEFIAHRSQLMQQTAPGAMTVVLALPEQVMPFLHSSLSISVLNSPKVTVVSGTPEDIATLEADLKLKAVDYRRVHTTRAFHSSLMEPILTEFKKRIEQFHFSPPSIPIISNITGTWMTNQQATSASYWTDHIRQPVNFSEGITTLNNDFNSVFLEIGPGNTLATLVKQHPWANNSTIALASTRHPKQNTDDITFIYKTIGHLWMLGYPLDWNLFHGDETLSRIPLCEYPFERQQFSIDFSHTTQHKSDSTKSGKKKKKNTDKKKLHPRSTEEHLCEIWKDLLGVESINTDTSFFDLGGHSLLAAQLFERIKKEFNKNLPLATLLANPTIHDITSLLKNESDSATISWSPLVPIQKNGSKPPLFLVHGAEGNILLYRPLSKHLGEDQPLYGLQARGLDGTSHFIDNIPEMATLYIDEMVKVQPEGPYYIGGYCMGGMIAFEMCRQLENAGKKVGLILLIESYNACAFNMSEKQHNRFLPFHTIQNIYFHTANLLSSIRLGQKGFISDKLVVARSRIASSLSRTGTTISDIIQRKPRKEYIHIALSKVNDHAYFEYTPTPCHSNIAVFSPAKHFMGYNDPAAGWTGMTSGNVSVHVIPSLPRGMLVDPFAIELAKSMRAAIDEVIVTDDLKT